MKYLHTSRGDSKSTNIFLAIHNARNFCARAGASYERQREKQILGALQDSLRFYEVMNKIQ